MIIIKLRINKQGHGVIAMVKFEQEDTETGRKHHGVMRPHTFGQHLLKVGSFKWADEESAEVYRRLK